MNPMIILNRRQLLLPGDKAKLGERIPDIYKFKLLKRKGSVMASVLWNEHQRRVEDIFKDYNE